LFRGEPADVIVSPRLVSYLLSQVALRRELAALFGELSRPRGAQIVLRPVQNSVAMDHPVRFDDVDRAAAARGEIALGVRRSEDRRGANLMLNPDRAMQWTLGPDDAVVVLASHAAAKEVSP